LDGFIVSQNDELAVALQAAHEGGVIHRDLKLSNVMINPRGEPVIMDFGLARRLRQEARLTKLGHRRAGREPYPSCPTCGRA
jgi:serine/threonine protein kinase